ncbi:AIR synthase-related protein [Pontibacter sp. G13]|uniref:AIR synthase-related protein n=1 Tax=Pontibacter sp. G13 TaxID=3074898 RepID=UPI00288BAFFB|nr:AIR synthase-related protein [Pontibacter sp. G13]WNJ20904.1 AIR synthase-related protein [Pontibacter sp. G13]
MSSKYSQRGVSAGKEDVHFAIRQLDKGLYPNAFCKILPDLVAQDEEYCTIMHADGAGTKSSLAYLYWKETGDLSVWKGIIQDGIVMNLDDMLCAGATNHFMFSNTIGRNAFYISRDVLATMLNGMEELFDMLRSHGIEAVGTGGETADVGDLVRTIIYDATAFCRMPRKQVVTNEKIGAGNVIVGLASYGKASYEDEYNSGIGSNGLTNGRHDTLHKSYADKYPESCDTVNVPKDLMYAGPYKVTDSFEDAPLPVGKLLLSPTRTYLPLMKGVLDRYHDKINGLIHCTGGGQTKVLKFVKNLHVIKDNMLDIPPVFRMIHGASGAAWKEMYQVFNMGHRLEVYTDEETAKAIIDEAGKFEIHAQVIGRTEAAEQNKLTLHGAEGVIEYAG